MDIDKLLAPYEKQITIHFTISLRSGDEYSHWYLVPERIVKQGYVAMENYIAERAMNDLVCICIEG